LKSRLDAVFDIGNGLEFHLYKIEIGGTLGNSTGDARQRR